MPPRSGPSREPAEEGQCKLLEAKTGVPGRGETSASSSLRPGSRVARRMAAGGQLQSLPPGQLGCETVAFQRLPGSGQISSARVQDLGRTASQAQGFTQAGVRA